MKVKFMFSSSEGNIELDKDVLNLPFKLSLTKQHKWMRLKDYFELICSFVQDRFCLDNLNELYIISEKHGSCYNVASAWLISPEKIQKYAILVAIGDKGDSLAQEYFLLNKLGQIRKSSNKYLPRCYYLEQKRINGETVHLAILEWFDRYYEWHILENGNISVWDTEEGYYTLKKSLQPFVYQKCAYILTYLFDPFSLSQVYPWHHSAGDFVLKVYKDDVDVKLTTVRSYAPVLKLDMPREVSIVISLVYFFLNMSIKMRLDKKDGIKKVLLAPENVVIPVLKGFTLALQELVSEGHLKQNQREQILNVLYSLNKDELKKLFYSMLNFYTQEDPLDLPVILANTENHINSLYYSLKAHLQ